MLTPRHLKRAPIKEAIVDFRVKRRPEFKVEDFLRLKNTLAAEFPVVEERFLFEGELNIGPSLPVPQFTSAKELDGYWFKSLDGLNIAQFRRDGFTFSRLEPYTSWEEVFPRAWRLWLLYIETGAAEFVTRVALRYINKLVIPTTTSNLAVYLTALPPAPEGFSGDIASFLTRLVLNTRDDNVTANITQALEKGDDPKNITVILDIDVYKLTEFEIEDSAIRSVFDSLHDLKNNIFFSSITEEAARLCQ